MAGEPRSCGGSWGYQWCTEMVQPFTSGTARDMFWPYAPYNYSASAEACVRDWGVTPREGWARVGLGGKRIGDASKILFSNGRLDPWSGGGVLEDISDDLPAVLIPSGAPSVHVPPHRPCVHVSPSVHVSGAHHIDLMFSDPADPPDVTAARESELDTLLGWVGVRAESQPAAPRMPSL